MPGRRRKKMEETLLTNHTQNPTGGDAADNARSASHASHAPLAELRAVIASSFATEISAVTPRACTALQDQGNQCADSEEKQTLAGAAHRLTGRQQQMTVQIDRSLRRRFDAKLDSPPDSVSHTGQFSAEALMLIEELGMQEEYELEQCVGQLREQCQTELFRLTISLRRFLDRKSLPESRNPVFPRVLLRALMDSLAHIGFDVRARRAALRVYRPLLPRIITAVYARANAILANSADGGAAAFDTCRRRARPAVSSRTMAAAVR
jgi:hypothetical protein